MKLPTLPNVLRNNLFLSRRKSEMFVCAKFCKHGRKGVKAIWRHYSQKSSSSMQVWQAHEYGSPDILNLNTSARIPVLTRPTDVLVKIHAASVNPIDVMMLRGYGTSVINVIKQINHCTLTPQEFPLTPGRDFSGTVVRTGSSVKNLKPGDEIWGVVGVENPGSHAEYAITSEFYVSRKPHLLNNIEAASMPYAALTAWCALSTFGQLSKSCTHGKRVLVAGASGGIGTIAVQILKAWGAEVTAICSTDAVELVQSLGTDHVIDYQLQDVQTELKLVQGFDFILDAVGAKNKERNLDLLKKWKNSKYVTIVSPLLKNADDYGLVLGTMKSSFEAACDTLMGLKDGRSMRWAYVIPHGRALKGIAEMVDEKQIVPVIDEVFKFEDTPEAYRKVINGHARGKTVISNVDIPEQYIKQSPVEQQPVSEEPIKAAAVN